jgi:cobalt/nickel transport system permease protein
MLLEQLSYTNRWRRVHPGAKFLFAASGVIAASISVNPYQTLLIALLLTAAAVIGAGIPVGSYLKVLVVPLLFLLVSGVTLAIDVGVKGSYPWFKLSFPEQQIILALKVCSRSLGCVAALLFLAFTTPLNDIISLLRKFSCPSILTDLMTLCFRTLFVFTDVIHDISTAQSSRMGYATTRNAMNSLGTLVAALVVQVWQRSVMLHQSALSRANDGPLYFLTPEYPWARSTMFAAVAAGAFLIILAVFTL